MKKVNLQKSLLLLFLNYHLKFIDWSKIKNYDRGFATSKTGMVESKSNSRYHWTWWLFWFSCDFLRDFGLHRSSDYGFRFGVAAFALTEAD